VSCGGLYSHAERRWCRYVHLLFSNQAPAAYINPGTSRVLVKSITLLLHPPSGWQKPVASVLVGSGGAGIGKAWASVARYDDNYVQELRDRGGSGGGVESTITWGGVGGQGEFDQTKMFRSCGKMVSGGTMPDASVPLPADHEVGASLHARLTVAGIQHSSSNSSTTRWLLEPHPRSRSRSTSEAASRFSTLGLALDHPSFPSARSEFPYKTRSQPDVRSVTARFPYWARNSSASGDHPAGRGYNRRRPIYRQTTVRRGRRTIRLCGPRRRTGQRRYIRAFVGATKRGCMPLGPPGRLPPGDRSFQCRERGRG